jgi:hypothetical protein
VATLKITKDANKGDGGVCYTVEWTSKCLTSLEDSFDVSKGFWFVGPEQYEQHFPLKADQCRRDPVPLLPGDFLQNAGRFFGGVAEPYWLNSEGVAIWVPPEVPLFYAWKDGLMNLSARRSPPYHFSRVGPLKFTYKICHAGNPKQTHMFVSKRFLGFPASWPVEEVLQRPIWSTWAQYKAGVTAEDVRSLAASLKKHDLPCSQLEIDDRWESHYGDALFDPVKFPDPVGLVWFSL